MGRVGSLLKRPTRRQVDFLPEIESKAGFILPDKILTNRPPFNIVSASMGINYLVLFRKEELSDLVKKALPAMVLNLCGSSVLSKSQPLTTNSHQHARPPILGGFEDR
jgi:hypothetical protein